MEKLNFEQFQKWCVENILEHLHASYSSSRVELHRIDKLGSSYIGLSVRKGEADTGVVADLNRYYEEYLNTGDADKILSDMARCIQNQLIVVKTNWLSDYEQVKQQLFVRVSNYERNLSFLQNVPFTKIADMAVTYHIRVQLQDGTVGNTIIKNEMLAKYGIDQDTLHSDALRNAKSIYTPYFFPLHAYAPACCKINEDQRKALVVTNTQQIYGASVLFYPGVKEYLVSMLGKKFYVIPSSIHELIACVIRKPAQVESLKEDIVCINRTIVREDEWLSDHLYHYDHDRQVFEAVQ